MGSAPSLAEGTRDEGEGLKDGKEPEGREGFTGTGLLDGDAPDAPVCPTALDVSVTPLKP